MRVLFVAIALLLCDRISAADVEFLENKPGALTITVAGRYFADYVYQDKNIPRPHFKSVRTREGFQVTRNQPPSPETDIADHPLFHPGIWFSFGDLSGSDYWRLAAKVKFVQFKQPRMSIDGAGEFTAQYQLLTESDADQVVCEELFRCQIVELRSGTLLCWDSKFSSDREFAFGDQEEMGLGIRMATPLRAERQPRGDIEPGTGTIIDAEGRENGDQVWGTSSAWCDYSGKIGDQTVGITIFCHPENFRPSWFHARDYGLLVANPFGRHAFKQGSISRVVVSPGETFRLRYGLLVHSGSMPDLAVAYREYLSLTDDGNRASTNR